MRHDITVIGAGIFGLWQALTLARAGHRVTLIERSPEADPFGLSASRYAGAMLAPDTEAEAAPRIVRDLGREALGLWAATLPVQTSGSLVVAPRREPGELRRFARMTERHVLVQEAALAQLEPELADRFDTALHFPGEAHMAAHDALTGLLAAARQAGARVEFGVEAMLDDLGQDSARSSWTIDCRGISARGEIADLRGVRGERLLLQAPDVHLSRPVRYLDPRVPLYIVPWPDNVYMVGATVIESDDAGPISVRSASELMAAACALHPGFAEAAILEAGAGVRPSLPDNVPRAQADAARRIIRINGAYRHGFLLAPIVARSVAAFFDGATEVPLMENRMD